ncbi:AidA/PixA family protein [Burkholderia ubonensis]
MHFDSTIKGHGAERLEIAFVHFVHLYDRQRQDLLGYCMWSPTIIVV